MKKILFILFLINITVLSGKTLQELYTYLSADTLNKYEVVYLDSNWLYHPGDSIKWADKYFDDSDWKPASTNLNDAGGGGINFDGKGWFRLKLQIDSSLINKPLALGIWLSGACDIYINGKKKFSIGKILPGGKSLNKIPLFPETFTFRDTGYNVFAVRYFNSDYKEYANHIRAAGFSLRLGLADKYTVLRYSYLSEMSLYKIIFITIPLSLAVLHLFLFFFDTRQKQNLYYVLFLFFFAVFIYIIFTPAYSISAPLHFLMYKLSPAALVFTLLFGATTIYSIYRPLPKYYKYIVFIALSISVLGFFIQTILIWYITYIFIISVSIGGSRVLYNRKYQKPAGSDKILQIGFAIMAGAGILQMLMSVGIIEPIYGVVSPYIYGVLIFIFAMSISLARDFAITRKSLEKKLNEVKELSERTLKQELAAKELEIKRRILEADNKRKTDELESARNVQLAMLPQCLNDIEGYDICFDMYTATEVGGDYYDYILTEDKTLNVTIGDATGHGMKAGIMVATIKSLFSALGTKMMIPDFFEKATGIIKNMSLGNLFMSMTVIRIKDKHVHGSSAGMPPLLVYGNESNSVNEVQIKSMPLGGFKDFPYETFDFDVKSGDIILMMTDGFIETFNDKKEMLGLEKAKKYFNEAYDSSANDIADYLNKKGKEWRGGVKQKDDVTFVVIKIL